MTFVWHRAGCSAVRCIKVAFAINRDGIARITGSGVFAPRADFLAANTRYYDSAYQLVLLKHNPVEANRLFDEVGWNSHDAAEAEAEAGNADILLGAVCWWTVSWPVRQPVSRQGDHAISPHTTSSQVLDGPRNIQNPYAGFAPAFFLGAMVFQIRSMRSQTDSVISAPCIATRFSTEAFSRFASTHSNQKAIKNYNSGYARTANTILASAASAASARHKQPRHRRTSGRCTQFRALFWSLRFPAFSTDLSRVPGYSVERGNGRLVLLPPVRVDVQTVIYAYCVCNDRATRKERIEREYRNI